MSDLNDEQTRNLNNIVTESVSDISRKYRRGVVEHGGNLTDMTKSQLIREAINEVNDLTVYLYTLLEKINDVEGIS